MHINAFTIELLYEFNYKCLHIYIFDNAPFMSPSSNYGYKQRRGYQKECRLIQFEIRNTSDFIELLILVEMGLGCLVSSFFLLPIMVPPIFDIFLNELPQ